MRLRQLIRRECGASLLVSLGVVVAIGIAGASAAKFSTSNARSSEFSVAKGETLHLAEAGLAHSRSILWNASDPTDPSAVTGGTFTLEGGTVTFSGTYDSGTQIWTLTGARPRCRHR